MSVFLELNDIFQVLDQLLNLSRSAEKEEAALCCVGFVLVESASPVHKV